MKDNKNRDKARQIESLLNDITFDAEGVANEMRTAHRTLQQNFTRLAVEWLKVCASENYQYDDRNEASHVLAKKLIDGADISALPFI